MSYLRKHWLTLILATIITIALSYLTYKFPAKATKETFIEIEAHNTSPFTIEVEAKCDWRNDIRAFDFHKIYRVKSKRMAVISVPNRHKRCQVWSRVRLLESK